MLCWMSLSRKNPLEDGGISGSKDGWRCRKLSGCMAFPHEAWGTAFQSWFLFGLLPIANGVLSAIVGVAITGLRPARKDNGGWSSMMSGTVYGINLNLLSD